MRLGPADLGAAVAIAVATSIVVPPATGEPPEALNRHLAQAQIHLDAQRYELVVAELQAAISIQPDIPGAHYQLGLAHWHLRNTQQAKAAFQRELEFEPPDAYSLYYLGRIALAEGESEEAVGFFERTLSIGTVLDVRTRLASGYLRSGRVEDAVRLLEETVSRWPEQSESHYLLGRAYQRQGRAEQARQEFDLAERWKSKLQNEIQQLVELRMLLQNRQLMEAAAKARALSASGDPDVMLGAAVALGRHGFHGEALPILRRVVAARPRNAEAHFNMALAHISLKRQDEAVKHLRTAVELRPEFFEARMLLGNLLVQAGNGEAAIPHLRVAISIRPENAKLAALLGLQYMQGNYYQQAVDILHEAVAIDQANADLRFLLVDAHYKNHDFERSLEEARRALADFPDLANSHYQVAWQLENMGRFPEAKPHLESALAIDPDFTEARRMLGEIVLRLGDAEGSLEHFRRAIGQDPAAAQAYAGLGKALIQLKRYEQAAVEMETAIGIDPDLASLRLQLSQAYRAMGRMEDAKREAAVFAKLNQERARRRDQDVERTYVPGPEELPR